MNAANPEPMPTPGRQNVLDLVIADLQARSVMGTHKYGTPLMTFNGRNALMDLTQELLDALVYCRQELAEREVRAKAHAALSRAAWAVLHDHDRHWHWATSYTEAIDALRTTLNQSPLRCACDPPGSGEEYCAGHCEHSNPERTCP